VARCKQPLRQRRTCD